MPLAKSFSKKAIATVAALLVVIGTVAAVLVVRDRQPSSFRRGGQFLATGPEAEPSTTVAPLPGTTTVPPSTTSSVARSSTTRPSSATTMRAAPPAATPTVPAPQAGPLPAFGTYVWNVSGNESATAFGSRALPPQMTMVVHGGPGVGARQVVADIAYSPDHTEREILDYRDDGVYMSFEAGAVKFGIGSQTNQGDYSPAMLQVPLPASPGVARTGVSEVRDGGGVTRVEDWSVSVIGEETVTIGGQAVPTWKVTIDRQSRPGASQQVTRSRTYWFDPARRIWVKYTERLHGQQGIGILTFSYDETLSATLSSFKPA